MKNKGKQERNLSENRGLAFESVIQELRKENLVQLFTPTVIDFSLYEKYVHVAHQNQIVKLSAPNGIVKALRYDSTISMIASNQVHSDDKFFYIEPQFAYDFDNLKIMETTQLGVEFIEGQSDHISSFEKCILLAKSLADLLCTGEYQIEVSHTDLVDTLTRDIELDLKSTNDLKHYISRKNERKVLDVLEKNQVDPLIQNRLLELSRIRASVTELTSNENSFDFPNEINEWLSKMMTLNLNINQPLVIDFTSSYRLTYYKGNVFKVYDMTSHKEIISGGEYCFKAYGVRGCGFSIKL
ncbi:ATP phosphoribosyltransferase regulatory subunit [Fusibacter bizertensis]|uniref:ATP phosphoribosyltransferase regulatory subunit n=1 Tax=Fusibacter bizertensis TaxID=1488331 RepID=A0ABT6NCR3_9FIRM|nr:ATP phosphoribosyltransferase regulatory subunit [Fusibacter bizertensis]MDH8678209.1 ATP phosphoribosyltransferase regulatory subunit [Fusibacter bizertensis]